MAHRGKAIGRSDTKERTRQEKEQGQNEAVQSGRVGNPPKERSDRKDSGNQFADGFDVLRLMQGISEKDADKLSDTGKEEIDLNGDGTVGFTGVEDEGILEDVKELPHNARGPLAGEFQPLAVCKNLDYPPGNLRFLQFAID